LYIEFIGLYLKLNYMFVLTEQIKNMTNI
jgi:hypothetical protein